MASLNMVQLIGYLGRAPEVKYSQSGQPVANFSLATDESYIGQDGQKVDRTEWHRVIAFGKQADLIAKYLHKGSHVYVQGCLQTRKWQDQDGNDRYTTEIKAFRVQFLDSKKDAEPNGTGQQPPQTKGVEHWNNAPTDEVPF